MIPDKIPDFLGTGIRLLEFPPDPNPTFYYPIYSIPDFLLPDPPLHLISKSYFDIEQGIKFQSFIVTMHSFKKRDHLIFQSINCAHKNLKRKNFDFTSFLGERTIYFNPKKVQCCHDRKTFRELSTRYLKPPAMVSYEKCQISTSFADFQFPKKPNLVTLHFIHMISRISRSPFLHVERKRRFRDSKKITSVRG